MNDSDILTMDISRVCKYESRLKGGKENQRREREQRDFMRELPVSSPSSYVSGKTTFLTLGRIPNEGTKGEGS
jgi:hypothetical protein